MINSALIVCTGNICRSPIAETMLAAQCPNLKVSSAGVGALIGYPAAKAAIEAAAEIGLDISAHRARQVDAAMLPQHDLILAMETAQIEWLEAQFPVAKGRSFLLSRWTDQADVPDPYGRDIHAFRETVTLMQPYIAAWRSRLAPSVSRPSRASTTI